MTTPSLTEIALRLYESVLRNPEVSVDYVLRTSETHQQLFELARKIKALDESPDSSDS